MGKLAMLSLQYGAGAARFAEMVRIELLKNPHLTIPPIDLSEAYKIVDLYRSVHHKVQQLWWRCDKVILPAIANGSTQPIGLDVNDWFVTQLDGFGRPGEPGVMYKDLAFDGNEWSYRSSKGRVHIYGAKVVENLCQHAAMLVVMWQTARINQRYPVALSVHDEVVCVVRDEEVADAKAYMEECLTLAPKWCRGVIPLKGEVNFGQSYGDAK